MSERRIAALARREIERRIIADRRAALESAEHRRHAMDVAAPPIEPVAKPGPEGASLAEQGEDAPIRGETEVSLPRSTELRADPEIGRERGRDAAPASAPRDAPRHAH
jgi:hypothetical protein